MRRSRPAAPPEDVLVVGDPLARVRPAWAPILGSGDEGGGGGAPAASEQPAAADRAPAAERHRPDNEVPGVDDLPSDAGPEQQICRVHPAMLRAHPFRGLLLTVMAIGGLALTLWAVIEWDTNLKWLSAAGIPLLLGSIGWWVTWWFFSTVCIKLEITNKRTIRHEGFIRRSSTEVLHDHVRSVDIKQGFIQRICNTGYIGIDSAGQDGIEIEIKDIPSPYEVKAIIDRYRQM